MGCVGGWASSKQMAAGFVQMGLRHESYQQVVRLSVEER